MASLSLDPVSAGVYTLLNVDALTALAPGGISDDTAQQTTFPFVWYEVSEAADLRGFGTGGLPEVDLRVHVFSTYEGMREAHLAMQQVIELLKDQKVSVDGYTHCGHIFYDRTVPLPEEELNGVKCHELVSFFRFYVEETA